VISLLSKDEAPILCEMGSRLLRDSNRGRTPNAREAIIHHATPAKATSTASCGVFERSDRNSNREKSKEGLRLSCDLGPKWHDMSRGLSPWVSNMGRVGDISGIQNLMSTTNSPCPCVYRCRADMGCEQIVRRTRRCMPRELRRPSPESGQVSRGSYF